MIFKEHARCQEYISEQQRARLSPYGASCLDCIHIYIIPKKIDSQTFKCPKQAWQRFWLPPNILPWSVRAEGSCFSKRGKHRWFGPWFLSGPQQRTCPLPVWRSPAPVSPLDSRAFVKQERASAFFCLFLNEFHSHLVFSVWLASLPLCFGVCLLVTFSFGFGFLGRNIECHLGFTLLFPTSTCNQHHSGGGSGGLIKSVDPKEPCGVQIHPVWDQERNTRLYCAYPILCKMGTILALTSRGLLWGLKESIPDKLSQLSHPQRWASAVSLGEFCSSVSTVQALQLFHFPS